MDDKTLVERLDILIKDDHERGCQGRYFSCTCGYDNDCSQAMQDAKSRIEALEAALRGMLGNEVAEERIGWRGSSPSNPDLYQCEYCHKEHYDCTEIEHLDDCPILAARQALAGDDHGHR